MDRSTVEKERQRMLDAVRPPRRKSDQELDYEEAYPLDQPPPPKFPYPAGTRIRMAYPERPVPVGAHGTVTELVADGYAALVQWDNGCVTCVEPIDVGPPLSQDEEHEQERYRKQAAQWEAEARAKWEES